MFQIIYSDTVREVERYGSDGIGGRVVHFKGGGYGTLYRYEIIECTPENLKIMKAIEELQHEIGTLRNKYTYSKLITK